MDPTMCRAGCGFFGSEKFDSFCSQCFKQHCPDSHQQQPSTAARPSRPVESPKVPSPAPEASKEVEKPMEKPEESSDPSPPKKTNRCTTCNKRVGLLGFSCESSRDR
ncbi:hypothetical protein QR680_007090 [Steinernema hermaphroditum]|uniref:A20-type domain-containing protein n=1 Tax=Steinernema hermaphroditum TaxID=289476 RepID=A0AA39HXI8_9BILA|nr:hypothetical protein QR680_007090 [Steinernema hermaphroditum]